MEVAKIYAKDGSLGYEGEVKNGKPYGQGKAFRPDGSLKLEGTFGIKGLLEGKIYYPDGTIRFDGKFSVNRGYGPNKPVEGILYDEDGKEIFRGEMRVVSGSLGYPIIRGPEGFSIKEYSMPVTPYMWSDDEKERNETQKSMEENTGNI